MKKTLICIMSALLILFSLAGCREKPESPGSSAGPEANPSGTAQTEPAEMQPTETQPPEEAHLPILPLDDSQMADPAARVIDRTPLDGREGLTIPGITKLPTEGIGISYHTAPSGLTVYPNASPNSFLRGIHYSFKPWDLTSFTMEVNPFRSTIRMEAEEWTPEAAPQLDPAAQPDALPYYVYASWRGMDWKELARLELAARENPDDEDAARVRDAFRDQYLEDFLALQPEDLPSLPYLYELIVSFPPEAEGGQVVDETISSLEFTAVDYDGDGYSIGGEGISLRAEDPRPAETPGLTLSRPGYEVLAAPLNDGDCRAKAMEFTAEADLILHSFKLYKSRIQIEALTVLRTRNGETREESWDGADDLSVQAGETVEILLTLHDPEAENSGKVIRPDGVDYGDKPENAKPEDRVIYSNATLGAYCRDQFCILDYSLGEQTHTAVSELILRRDVNLWELIFLLACDGDHQFSTHLYSYYLDYYNPLYNPAWQGETPSLEETP